jgi:methyl-accepting chemotaxis protein
MNTLMDEVGGSVSSSQERLGKSIDSLETVAIALSDVTSVVNDVSAQVQTISTSANEQQSVSQEMASKLNEITLAVQEENRQVDEMATSAEDLNRSIRSQFDLLASFNQDRIMLQTVKADHLVWKIHMTMMAMGGELMPENELVDHTQCRLGKWYYSIGTQRYGQREEFQRMEPHHARIHEIGREIAELSANGQIPAARQKIDELENHSVQLNGYINQLLEHLQT